MNINGQLASDKEFLAHKNWTLLDSKGNPVMNAPGQPFFDTSNPEMRAWFVDSTINAIHSAFPNIDGIFADGSGTYIVNGHNISAAKNEALNQGHTLMLAALLKELHALRSDFLLLGNGAVLDHCYPPVKGKTGPCSYNLDALDGVCAEHFGSFEAVNKTTGNFDGPSMENWLDILDYTSRMQKIVLVKGWPGPINMYCNKTGGDCQFTWLNESKSLLNNTQKKVLGARALDWTLASYLLIAESNTFLSYSWWYSMTDGVVPCPTDPDSCSCPNDFYPNLEKPTGLPLGPRTRIKGGSGHMWTRQFEKVIVTVDLGNFNSVSLTWK